MESDAFMRSPVVIDNGSGYMKVGFSGQQKRPHVIPTIVGRPKYRVVIPNTDNQMEVYMGKNLQQNKRGLYKIRYPIQHGVISNWDDMELLWKYAFTDLLKISTNQCPVLLTEPNMNPTKHRKRLFEIFFEKFQVPAVFVAVQGVLSLFATGRSTGIVLDSGDGVTHVVPVYEGYQLTHASQRIDLGGRDVTQHLRSLMRKSGINMNTTAQFQLVKNIKEKYCVISTNSIQKGRQKRQTYKLPDGEQVQFSSNQKEAGEILFSPNKIGLQCPNIVQILTNSLSKVDIDLRMTLYNQIVLSGGNTMIEGFPQRFIKQLKKSIPNEAKSRVLAPAKRDMMCWQGGSILAGLPSFRNMWVTKQQYQEKEQNILTRKNL